MIPMSEPHLLDSARVTTHYNHGRPHSALGPGVPIPQKHEVDLLETAIAWRRVRSSL
jgi:hypothetical protein